MVGIGSIGGAILQWDTGDKEDAGDFEINGALSVGATQIRVNPWFFCSTAPPEHTDASLHVTSRVLRSDLSM